MLADRLSRVVLVTGGANGIGLEYVKLMYGEGARITVADLENQRETFDTWAMSLTEPERLLFHPCDVTHWESMKSAFEKTIDKFGSIDVVVTSAGIMETEDFFSVLPTDGQSNEPPKEPLETFRVIDVNLKGTIIALKLAFHFMRSNVPDASTGSRGSIIFLTSLSGYFGGTSVVGYVTSKHGVVGLLRSAQKTAKALGLQVNAVAPILTPTHITQSYTEKWVRRGLPFCTASNVASSIAQVAHERKDTGCCFVVLGETAKEIEKTREGLLLTWMGPEIMDFVDSGRQLFEVMGGYPLPGTQRQNRG